MRRKIVRLRRITSRWRSSHYCSGEVLKVLGTAPVPLLFRKPYALVAVEIGPWIVVLIAFKYVMNLVDLTENALDT